MGTPQGWHEGLIEHRYLDTKPRSYDATARSVDAVISTGSPVKRFYGTEVLRIAPEAVVLDRMIGGGIIPLLDSHKADGIAHILGRVEKVWFNRGTLMGSLTFNGTPQGEAAMGMVSRGEITGISAGYCVREWEITDDEGTVLDPEVSNIRWDENLTFTATKWELHEASLVSVPADSAALVRSIDGAGDAALVRATRDRMLARQALSDIRARIGARHRMYEQTQK